MTIETRMSKLVKLLLVLSLPVALTTTGQADPMNNFYEVCQTERGPLLARNSRQGMCAKEREEQAERDRERRREIEEIEALPTSPTLPKSAT